MTELKRIRTVCFTGHRPNHWGTYDETTEQIKDVKTKLEKAILNAYHDGYTNFVTGMALGVDQWSAEIILGNGELRSDPGVFLVAALPCKEQERMWPTDAQRRYQDILNDCDKVVNVTNSTYKKGCMDKRNRWMVDNSSLVIAAYSGKRNGGTYNCVNYAERCGVPVVNVMDTQTQL